jgi:putative toxin-antitoxin system antitoxin component (TIGR02293 family)
MITKARASLKTAPRKSPKQQKSQGVFESNSITSRHFVAVKKSMHMSDAAISELLNISPKTYQTYKKAGAKINDNIKSRLAVLLQIFEHGIEVFGSGEKFYQWLSTDNFHFDKKPPMEFLYKINGPQFIDDRLTGLEYGDNA